MTHDLRVLLADDHAGVREMLHIVLSDRPSITVAGEAEDGRRTLELVETVQPDVVLMDIVMPVMDGLEATRRVTHDFPQTKVVIVTTHEDERYVQEAMRAGAMGYVLKRSLGKDLLNAIEAALREERYISPGIEGK